MSSSSTARLRPSQLVKSNGSTTSPEATPAATTSLNTAKSPPTMNSPYLPTPTEAVAYAVYPALLLFGSLFSLISPETRAAPYDPVAQAHVQDPSVAPSYFARKNNILNKLFVKQGWAWMMAAFFLFAFTHGSFATGTTEAVRRRMRALARFGLVTAAWFFVTQWFFGPPVIDRHFAFTGGSCVAGGVGGAMKRMAQGVEHGEVLHLGEVWTAVGCRAAGGKWKGGHDISGHVFLLVLGSGALIQEVGWVLWRACERRIEERCILMPDGAVKSSSVEYTDRWQDAEGTAVPGIGAKVAAAVIALSGWMILMTAIYFHTWFEKVTGLLVALSCLYTIYILPRWIPTLRTVVGIPGI